MQDSIQKHEIHGGDAVVSARTSQGGKMVTPSAQAMRCATGAFPTGITFVAAVVDGHPVGLLANSFTSVSLDPPLVSVSVARTSTTWPALRDATSWGISVLSAGQAENVKLLSRPAADRFAGIDWYAPDDDGSVLLTGSSATFHVSVEAEVDAGDHILVLLRVQDLRRNMENEALVFYGSQLRQLAA